MELRSQISRCDKALLVKGFFGPSSLLPEPTRSAPGLMKPTRFEHSVPTEHFRAIYATNPDPWSFATSPYEQDKYSATLAALPQRRYESTLEVGCSIGVFTRQLAPRCASLLALDPVASALSQARANCSKLPHVGFQRCRVPDEWPDGIYDLIVMSEVIYFLDLDDVAALAERVASSVAEGGDIVLVHWLGVMHYPLSGDEATEHFLKASRQFAKPIHQTRTADYRLDVLRAF